MILDGTPRFAFRRTLVAIRRRKYGHARVDENIRKQIEKEKHTATTVTNCFIDGQWIRLRLPGIPFWKELV
jgi:hypothetical protein